MPPFSRLGISIPSYLNVVSERTQEVAPKFVMNTLGNQYNIQST